MTPRFFLTFFAIFFVMVFAEWYRYLRGFDTSIWTTSNWMLLIGVLVAEAIAAAIMAAAVDHALPAAGNRAPIGKPAKRRRRR